MNPNCVWLGTRRLKGRSYLKRGRINNVSPLLSVFWLQFYGSKVENDSCKAPFIVFREGLPSWSLPPFGTQLGDRNVTFVEMCSDLGSSIVLVPIIGVLGNVAIAKAFGM